MTDKTAASSKEGRWTPEEHERFVKALSLYGKDWKQVEKYVGTRTVLQVRSHAQKYLLKIKKKYSNCYGPRAEQPQPEPEGVKKQLHIIEQEYFRKLNTLNYTYFVQMINVSKTTTSNKLPSVDLSELDTSFNYSEPEEKDPRFVFTSVYEEMPVKKSKLSETLSYPKVM
jgi:SHAQKYF class myb-like DNA-binding protein